MPAIDFTVDEAGVGLMTLNRPEVLNAINAEWVDDFHRILDAIRDDRAVRAVVITGAGRAFCGGFDLKASHDFNEATGTERMLKSWRAQERLAMLTEKMIRSRQPIIGAIKGSAVGGGFAIALACDMRVAGRSARFQVANARIGLSAGECGMSWLFPRLVGLSRCFELLVTGRPFDAEEAERIGLLSRLVDDDDMLETAMEIARAIAANPGFGVAMSKDVIYANLSAPDIRTASAIENRTQLLCGTTGDFEEAARAFREKRPPQFLT